MTRRYFVGVDVGGTFTDVVLASNAGDEALVRKVATTPEDPREGVATGVAAVLAEAGVAPGLVGRVVHGTTLATNVILERRGGPIAFVTTEGFGDMLRLGREVRGPDERFDLRFTVPEPPVSRALTFEVRERSDARGAVLTAPDPAHVQAVAARVAAAQPAGVAICFLHAYANPDHERLVAAACREALGPDVPVVASSEVWPEVREYERALTTVMCAYVGPVMSRYLAGLAERLRGLGVECPVEVMESSGGVLSAELAAQRPVCTVESGGAAGVVAAGFVGGLLDAGPVISFDMGGTTAKAGVVRDGRPSLTRDFHVGGSGSGGGPRAGGFPIRVPVVDLAEVGAGGGSIAWVDSGGALRVGPRSSGAVPGPACYGRGGVEATVTDADLVLGYLHEGGLSGGVSLSEELAREALRRHVAEPLGLDVVEAAWAVHEVANAGMAAAIRMVTVQRGIDPRDFSLVGFGGAGPMHAARLAETFGIDTVVIPWGAGVASAIGLVVSDLSVEQVRTRVVADHQLTVTLVQSLFDELEAAGVAALPQPAAGADDASGAWEVVRSVDARYAGQAHQLTVAVPGGRLTDDDIASVVKGFVARHEQVYGVTSDGPVELVSFRARVVRVVDKHQPLARDEVPSDGSTARAGERPVYDGDLGRHVSTPVLSWPALRAGATFGGPAVVEAPDTVVAVPSGWQASLDRWRNVVLRRRPSTQREEHDP